VESEREKVRLICEHPRHVTVASPGIPARPHLGTKCDHKTYFSESETTIRAGMARVTA
jgi:hypothetical protein